MKIKVTAASNQLSNYKDVLKQFGSNTIFNDGETNYAYIDIQSLDELLIFKDATKRKYEVYGELIITNDEMSGEPIIEIYDYYGSDEE